MKNWGTGAFLALWALGCAAPPVTPRAYEDPSDGKAMVDRLRVDTPYTPRQNGVAPLSVYIEAQPTYYPPVCWDYRRNSYPVSWGYGRYRPYDYRGPECRYRPAYPVCYKPRW